MIMIREKLGRSVSGVMVFITLTTLVCTIFALSFFITIIARSYCIFTLTPALIADAVSCSPSWLLSFAQSGLLIAISWILSFPFAIISFIYWIKEVKKQNGGKAEHVFAYGMCALSAFALFGGIFAFVLGTITPMNLLHGTW